MRIRKTPSVKGRGLKLPLTTRYDIQADSPAFPRAFRLCRAAALTTDMFPDNGGAPSVPTAPSSLKHPRQRFSPRLRSDLPRFPTRAGLPPSPARCAFEKSATVFLNVCPYLIPLYYSVRKMALSRGYLSVFLPFSFFSHSSSSIQSLELSHSSSSIQSFSA